MTCVNFLQAFSSLAEAAYDTADVIDGADEPETYILSQYYGTIVEKLLATTDRADGNNLSVSIFTYTPNSPIKLA